MGRLSRPCLDFVSWKVTILDFNGLSKLTHIHSPDMVSLQLLSPSYLKGDMSVPTKPSTNVQVFSDFELTTRLSYNMKPVSC